jgi:uncharacterized membrane protein YgdD (TMEM256/DUF423 family)
MVCQSASVQVRPHVRPVRGSEDELGLVGRGQVPAVNLGLVAGLLGAIGVAAGAFGAHALRERLDAASLATFETGARYHLLHAVAAVVAALRASAAGGASARRAGWLFVAGTLVFSGSLYGLALGGPRWLGAATPLGGLAFISGWLALGWSFRAR